MKGGANSKRASRPFGSAALDTVAENPSRRAEEWKAFRACPCRRQCLAGGWLWELLDWGVEGATRSVRTWRCPSEFGVDK